MHCCRNTRNVGIFGPDHGWSLYRPWSYRLALLLTADPPPLWSVCAWLSYTFYDSRKSYLLEPTCAVHYQLCILSLHLGVCSRDLLHCKVIRARRGAMPKCHQTMRNMSVLGQ